MFKLKTKFDLFSFKKDKAEESPKANKESKKNFSNIVKSVFDTSTISTKKQVKIDLVDSEYLPHELIEESQAQLFKVSSYSLNYQQKANAMQNTDEIVISQLDQRYYNKDFDPNELVLVYNRLVNQSSLPDEFDLDMLQLLIMKNKTENYVVNQIIEENINKEITKNYNGFIEGITSSKVRC